MNISLIKDGKIVSLLLPKKIEGQYWIEEVDDKGTNVKLIGIEAINGSWVLKSNKYIKILDSNNHAIVESVLENNSFYKLVSQTDFKDLYLYSEASTEDRYIFEKYASKNKIDITIGRDSKNKIVYNNPFVSSVHATLSFNGVDEWSIVDENSTNGTFVNGIIIDKKRELIPGDTVYILGLRIIIGCQYVAINNPDGNIDITSNSLVKIREQQIIKDENETIKSYQEQFYYRSPKFKREISTYNLKVDAPPTKEAIDETPMAFVIGPSMTMGIASIFTAMSSIVNYASQSPLERNFMSILPTIAMAVGMLAGTILWPILTRKADKKKKIKREAFRKEKYIDYLNECRQEIKNQCDFQRKVLVENNPAVEQIATERDFWEHDLWSREFDNDDFLDIRIGTGNIPLDCNIKFPEKSFSLDDDDLKEEVYKMANEDHSVTSVPIVHSLMDTKITGVASNNRSKTLEFLNSVILQLAMFHSYDELKLILITNPLEINQFQYAKWLPHLWDNSKTIRYIASSKEEVEELSVLFEKEINKVDENNDYEKQPPHYVVLVTNKELAYKAEFINHIIGDDRDLGFSIVYAFGEMKNLPKECSTVIEISDTGSTIYDKGDNTGEKQFFDIETTSLEDAIYISKELSNINLDLSTSSYDLPSMMTFLDMFGVGKIEHLNSLTRWKENNPVKSLKAPVGVDINGEPFMLDLHEKFHGPHGLIAGMTGSGKSEFIISFVLSLAVNYHPDEVAFILIDYKGGGLTGAFENDNFKLPHLAGTITNLDGSAVKRSLVSIQSELRNRQAEFNKARKIANEGTMDIYKYQQLYRNGVVDKPIPHLFIISDEFAELKDQQPDFMEQLISTARIGRSLGVHLILATQKPSGVVDDQIWSNSRFRVCLKVQDKSDSMDMIKRPDAAEISQTGRFYLQVGFNELFELGQSSWSGAQYIPRETTIEKEINKKVSLLDNLGREINVIKKNNIVEETASNYKQVVEVNKYIYKLAKEENAFAKQLWLEPIPAKILVDDIVEKYKYSRMHYSELEAIIGEYDDPMNQQQGLLKLQFQNSGNTAIYGATGSGKDQFITTMLYSLFSNYDAEELNTYILDFGSETLKVFEKAPQMSDVVLINETEKINNFFKQMQEEINNRKKLFANFGGSFANYTKKSDVKIPNILVVINNIASFSENYYDNEDMLMQLIREGNSRGIYFVVTASNYNEIKYRMSQNFAKQFVLQQNDNSDYSMILGNTNGLYPSKHQGRGLFLSDDGELFEFQTATVSNDNEIQFISDFVYDLSKKAETFATNIPVLPERVTSNYITEHCKDILFNNLVVGVNYNTLKNVCFNFTKHPIYIAVSQDIDDNVPFIIGISNVASTIPSSEVVVYDTASTIDENDNYKVVSKSFEEQFEYVYRTVVNRYKVLRDNNGVPPKDFDMHNIFCVINGLSNLLDNVSTAYVDKIHTMFEKCKSEFNVFFMISESTLGASKYSTEDWYKEKIQGNGLWIGDGVNDQFTLSVSKRTKDMSIDITNEYGFIINKGKANLIKLLFDDEE